MIRKEYQSNVLTRQYFPQMQICYFVNHLLINKVDILDTFLFTLEPPKEYRVINLLEFSEWC